MLSVLTVTVAFRTISKSWAGVETAVVVDFRRFSKLQHSPD